MSDAIDVYWLPLGAGGRSVRVVYGGPVGSRLLRRWRWFRYEVRCWRDGVIPDVVEAVASPVRVSSDGTHARRLLSLVPHVPPAVWGRDELRAGEGWNSNSVVAWLLVRSGVAADTIHPPPGGRAPGWSAGIAIATLPAPATSVVAYTH